MGHNVKFYVLLVNWRSNLYKSPYCRASARHAPRDKNENLMYEVRRTRRRMIGSG